MSSSIWVVTREINQYDQDGEYFVAGYVQKPTFADLKKLLPHSSDATLGKLTRGGGREKGEDEWYFLTERGIGERGRSWSS